MRTVKTMLLLGAVSCAASGCAPLIIGGAATTGVVVAQDRTAGEAVDDITIWTKIKHYFLQGDETVFSKVSVEVHEGKVVLTGKVPTADDRQKASELAWKPKGVNQVVNEIQISKQDGNSYARDAWITTQVKSKLLMEPEVRSVNYSVDTVYGTVYLMGASRNRHELKRAIEVTKEVKHVEKVVSHVRVGNDG